MMDRQPKPRADKGSARRFRRGAADMPPEPDLSPEERESEQSRRWNTLVERGQRLLETPEARVRELQAVIREGLAEISTDRPHAVLERCMEEGVHQYELEAALAGMDESERRLAMDSLDVKHVERGRRLDFTETVEGMYQQQVREVRNNRANYLLASYPEHLPDLIARKELLDIYSKEELVAWAAQLPAGRAEEITEWIERGTINGQAIEDPSFEFSAGAEMEHIYHRVEGFIQDQGITGSDGRLIDPYDAVSHATRFATSHYADELYQHGTALGRLQHIIEGERQIVTRRRLLDDAISTLENDPRSIERFAEELNAAMTDLLTDLVEVIEEHIRDAESGGRVSEARGLREWRDQELRRIARIQRLRDAEVDGYAPLGGGINATRAIRLKDEIFPVAEKPSIGETETFRNLVAGESAFREGLGMAVDALSGAGVVPASSWRAGEECFASRHEWVVSMGIGDFAHRYPGLWPELDFDRLAVAGAAADIAIDPDQHADNLRVTTERSAKGRIVPLNIDKGMISPDELDAGGHWPYAQNNVRSYALEVMQGTPLSEAHRKRMEIFAGSSRLHEGLRRLAQIGFKDERAERFMRHVVLRAQGHSRRGAPLPAPAIVG